MTTSSRLGAGDITKWAYALPAELEKYSQVTKNKELNHELSQQIHAGRRAPIRRSHLHWILPDGRHLLVRASHIPWPGRVDYNLWINFGKYIPAYELSLQGFRIAFAPGWIGWGMTAGGAFILVNEILKFLNTDLIMTNNACSTKQGFIKVKVDATDIGDILGVHIDQGWFGQFSGYGKIHLDCRFIEDVYIPYVKNPYGVMKALQRAVKGAGASA